MGAERNRLHRPCPLWSSKRTFRCLTSRGSTALCSSRKWSSSWKWEMDELIIRASRGGIGAVLRSAVATMSSPHRLLLKPTTEHRLATRARRPTLVTASQVHTDWDRFADRELSLGSHSRFAANDPLHRCILSSSRPFAVSSNLSLETVPPRYCRHVRASSIHASP